MQRRPRRRCGPAGSFPSRPGWLPPLGRRWDFGKDFSHATPTAMRWSWSRGEAMNREFLLLLLFAAIAGAQSLSYTRLAAEGASPAPRVDGAIVYEPSGRQIFLFGGQEGAPKNDLWVYSLDRRQWTELRPSDPRPPARFGHTLILDTVRRRLVVFGDRKSTRLNSSH